MYLFVKKSHLHTHTCATHAACHMQLEASRALTFAETFAEMKELLLARLQLGIELGEYLEFGLFCESCS